MQVVTKINNNKEQEGRLEAIVHSKVKDIELIERF